MIDRLIVSADETGAYEKQLFNKYISLDEKNRTRFQYQKKFKWIEGMTLRTFHGFCYQLLRNFGVNEFDNKFRIIGDEKSDTEKELGKHVAPETAFEVVHKLLIEMCDDPKFLLQLKRYILDYFIDKIQSKSGDPLHFPEGKYYTALDGTKVRSKSEQTIADWLFRHNIAYEYEPLLNVKNFNFRPDFFIPAANMYLEHISDKSAAMRTKEEQFKKGKLLLVKTYEGIMQDSALFQHTINQLLKGRLPKDHSLQAHLSFKETFHGYHEEVKDFLTQVLRVIDMIKVEDAPLESIAAASALDPHERVRGFYALALPIAKEYLAYCTNRSYLDFNDLISRSIALLKNHKEVAGYFQNKFKYILVDEFQDVNNLQVSLLKLLLSKDAQLFCVGDDWQSIYGFRGSNVSYIIDFERHFKSSEIIKLNLNYRSSNNIVGASNEVIKNNKFKIEKDIVASKQSEHKVVIYAGNTRDENLEFCAKKVEELLQEGLTSEDILFLYRRSKMFAPYFHYFKQKGIRVSAKTIHASKGLEAKVVFIIGLTEGSGGFPDVWMEDRIYQVIKPTKHNLLLEEERRLFYVAITRAKDKLFLITERGNESSFLREIPENFTVKTSQNLKPMVEKVPLCAQCFSQLEQLWKVCPYCGTPTA
jgi:superfamily I DNA/RNA helicase